MPKRAVPLRFRVFATLAAVMLLLTLPVLSARAQSRALRTAAATFLGPTPYLSKADSPFLTDLNAGNMYLEDFECGVLTVPGVALSDGTIIPPGFEGSIDSVDADDGVIDGSGLGGHSLFTGSGGTGITFTFNQTTLGAFPTKAGIVWTDGGGAATFEAFDSVGASLGTIVQNPIGDGSNSGETPEDRFFGVINAGGISAIKMSNTAGGIEVDHLQYGLYTVQGANLSLTKSDSPDPVAPGGTLTYTLTASIAGPATACQATVTDTLPAGVSFVSATGTGWNCSQASGVVHCTRTSLAMGTAPAITIVVNAPLTPGLITNTAAVTTNAFDPSTANNSAIETTLVGEGAPPTQTPTNTPTNTPTRTPTSVPTNTPTSTPTAVAATPTRTATAIANVVVPTLSFPMLALLGLALVGAALLFLRRP
jgi:uncharacterized repeat protein (TIGR01451 family)